MSAAQKLMINKLYACIVVDRGAECLFDLLAAPDADAALKTALKRKVNDDVRSDIARGCPAFASPVSDARSRLALEAAVERHNTDIDTLLADAIAFAVELERERVSRRYRVRGKKQRSQRRATALTAVPAETVVVETVETVVDAPAPKRGRLGWLAGAVEQGRADLAAAVAPAPAPALTPAQAAHRAERAAVEAQVRRADDGTTVLAGVQIGTTRDIEHAVNRAHKIVRTIKDSGEPITTSRIRALAAQYAAVAAEPMPALIIVDDDSAPAPAPAASQPKATAKAKAAPKAAAKRVAPKRRGK